MAVCVWTGLFKGSIFPISVAAVITNALGQDSQHVSVVVGVAFLTALMVDTIHRLEHQVHLSTKKKENRISRSLRTCSFFYHDLHYSYEYMTA